MARRVSTIRYLVYGLVDPNTKELRYVGKSSTGLQRPTHHWTRKSYREADDHCHRWVRSVLLNGKTPEIIIIEDNLSKKTLGDRERFWIAYHREAGVKLTNLTDGGDGITAPMAQEVRQKISKTRKAGHYVSWTKLNGHSKETKRKIGLAGAGRKQSKETLEKKSQSLLSRFSKQKKSGRHVVDSSGQIYSSVSELARVLGNIDRRIIYKTITRNLKLFELEFRWVK